MLAGALFLTACSHNSSLPPFTASGFAEDQGAVRIWRKDSGDNVHLLAVFSPWRSGDTTTREYRWQGDNLTLININVYSKPPVNIRARFDDRGDLSFMQRPNPLREERVGLDYLRPASSSSTSSTLVVCARRSMTDSSSSALVRLVIT